MDDLEFEEALPLLSADPVAHDPRTLSRRRFILGSLALAGVGTVLPAWRGREAEAAEGASPVGPDEGILVVVFLGGGNDGLNTIAPVSGPFRGRYEQLRGGLSIPAGQLLPIDDGWGMHPSLGALHGRYRRGRVAVVQGTGLPAPDLSHFTAAAQAMRGSASGAASGWLGRFLDGTSGADTGMRAMAVGSTVPLYLLGERAKVTAIPSDGQIWGADRSAPGTAALVDAVSELGAQPTGLGVWGDEIAQAGRNAVAQAEWASRLAQSDAGPAGWARDLRLAARLVNADLGTRVVGVTLGGWDTHIAQGGVHGPLLAQLDLAIESFFATLAGQFQPRVTMLVQSEFGRRARANASGGTDHGTAAPMLVVGENVRGGLHAAAPSLDQLDGRGNLVPTVDFRSVYGSLLGGWLRADAREVLGGQFEQLDLFASGPGAPRP